MKLESAHIDQIRTAFANMHSKEDLLHLLNKVKPFVYGEKAVSFELRQLTYYIQRENGIFTFNSPFINRATKVYGENSSATEALQRYRSFTIKKKTGGIRTLHAPVRGLKAIQKTLGFILQTVFEPHPSAMGFVRNRSIVDNAKIHAGQRYVYNIDLKDFFSSIDQARVWKVLQLKPFNLNTSKPDELAKGDIHCFIRTVTSIFSPGIKKTSILYYANKSLNQVAVDVDGKELSFSSEMANKLVPGLISSDGNVIKDKLLQLDEIANKRYRSNIDKGRLQVCNLIASLCCTEMEVERKSETGEWEKVKRNVLPQGAPTSPVITNIVCQRLDYLLTGVARRFGLRYSRYADDITFSSMHNVYQPESEFLKEMHRIIAEQNFHIKESKTRLQKDGYRKEVTGLLVNEKANVQQRYIKQLRMWLYYWERYGYERASGFFLQEYIADKGHVKNGKPDMANVISGKLDYLKMVKGNENELYLKLKGRFTKLSGVKAPIDTLLDIWENEGIDNAMNRYYNENDH